MDQNWVYEKCNTLEFVQGVEEFIKYVKENKAKNGEKFIVCPCCDSKNLTEQVKNHLIHRGTKKGYSRWI